MSNSAGASLFLFLSAKVLKISLRVFKASSVSLFLSLAFSSKSILSLLFDP